MHRQHLHLLVTILMIFWGGSWDIITLAEVTRMETDLKAKEVHFLLSGESLFTAICHSLVKLVAIGHTLMA